MSFDHAEIWETSIYSLPLLDKIVSKFKLFFLIFRYFSLFGHEFSISRKLFLHFKDINLLINQSNNKQNENNMTLIKRNITLLYLVFFFQTVIDFKKVRYSLLFLRNIIILFLILFLYNNIKNIFGQYCYFPFAII